MQGRPQRYLTTFHRFPSFLLFSHRKRLVRYKFVGCTYAMPPVSIVLPLPQCICWERKQQQHITQLLNYVWKLMGSIVRFFSWKSFSLFLHLLQHYACLMVRTLPSFLLFCSRRVFAYSTFESNRDDLLFYIRRHSRHFILLKGIFLSTTEHWNTAGETMMMMIT
jgi:hypothetical protein